RVCDALLPNRRGAVQVWSQVVVVQTAGFHRVRMDVPRIRRAEPAGISKGRFDCDLYGLGHSPQLDRQGTCPVRLSICRESQDLRRRCALTRLPTRIALITVRVLSSTCISFTLRFERPVQLGWCPESCVEVSRAIDNRILPWIDAP